MIEKLKIPKHINWDDTPEGLIQRHQIIAAMYETVNQLIDAVNALQLSMKPILEERKSEIKVCEEAQDMYDNAILDALKDKQVDVVVEPTDPYAKQRKWIGKLCRFWDDDPDDYVFDKLKEITFDGGYIKKSGFVYEHCEPVKPDDDIIYKGEQQ